MGYIFNKVNDNFGYTGTGSNGPLQLAPKLVPSQGTNSVHIVNDYPWTLTPLNSLARQETPYIRLREFYLLDSALNQAFQAYGFKIENTIDFFQAIGSGLLVDYNSGRLYQGLYDHNNFTGFEYYFPYFSESYLETTNSWVSKPFYQEIIELQQKTLNYSSKIADISVSGVGWLAELVGLGLVRYGPNPAIKALGGIIFGAGSFLNNVGPGTVKAATTIYKTELLYKRLQQKIERTLTSQIGSIGEIEPAIDKPYVWNNSAPRSFNVSFPLYNTIVQPDSKSWNAQIIKNWEFCYLLTYQNLFNKRNLFTGIPPVFYEIDIPGIHYSKAGYISNLEILNAGNIRSLILNIDNTNTTVNIPDAYIINFTVTDFFQPSKNFMSSIGNTNKGTLDDTITNLQRPESEEPQEQPDPRLDPNNPASVAPWRGGGDILCWVAREVYGIDNIKWIIFRDWLYGINGPTWLQKIYSKYGKQFAKFISNKPVIKYIIKLLMNIIVNKNFK